MYKIIKVENGYILNTNDQQYIYKTNLECYNHLYSEYGNKIFENMDCLKLEINSPKYGVKNFYVDTEDFKKIAGYKWMILFHPQINGFYVQAQRKTGKKNSKIGIHRVIMNCPKNKVVDHIDRNPLNNRKENLRICTHRQNMMNTFQKTFNGKPTLSGYKGVSYRKKENKFYAYIVNHGKLLHLGSYKYEIDAALVYNGAAKYLQGEYACLNKIKGV